MCQSIAEGGRRCFSHEKLSGSANQLKKRIAKAKKSGDREAYKEATTDFFTTETGILHLETQGNFEKAEKARVRRNKLIDEYNRTYDWHMAHFPSYESRATLKKGQRVWSTAGNHFLTKTKFNPYGWSQFGLNEVTGTKRDIDGNDQGGYGEDGFHKETELDRQGYARDGFHHETGRDRQGHKRNGYHHWTGLDRAGWDKDGWNHEGIIHRDTGTFLDPDGFDSGDYSPSLGIYRPSTWKPNV